MGGIAERFEISVHFRLRQIAVNAVRQNLFHEDVLLDNQFPTHAFGAELFKAFGQILRPIVPTGEGAGESFHERQAADVVLVAHGVVEAEAAAPVVQHQGDVL